MSDALDRLLYAVIFIASVLGSHGTPTLSLGFPSWSSFAGIGQRRDVRSEIKPYSGFRVQNDSLRMVYYSMQTIAIVELGPRKLLLNCELIEAYEPEDAMNLLHELSRDVSRPLAISFAEMMTLMGQCQQLETPEGSEPGASTTERSVYRILNTRGSQQNPDSGVSPPPGRATGGLLMNSPFTLFSGIIPGTKWCGTGDIATNYHDLGREANMDKCCRTHDLCPFKIKAYSNRYNLTNNSLYSKSHCQCDDNLFDCLKRVDTPTSNLMGNIYFNIVQVPCIEENSRGLRRFKSARNNF